MALLHIDLQEGFARDEVAVRINGNEVLHKSGVTTRNQIGLADSVEADLAPGTAQLEIALPLKGQLRTLPVQIASAPVYVGVSITPDGTINAARSETAFRYA